MMGGVYASTTDSLLINIRALMPTLNEQEQKVGEYILRNPESVLHLSISDLAHRSAASDATVFRFCKRVGAGGYGDLKIRLAQELAASRVPTYPEVDAGDSLKNAARKVAESNVKAIEDTLTVLDYEALDRLADILLGARLIVIFGVGGGAAAALELQQQLMGAGVHATARTDSEVQVMSAALLNASDLVIAISHSGESGPIVTAMQVAREAGATVAALTNHPSSSVAELADLCICTSAEQAHAHGFSHGERAAQVTVGDILHAYLVMKRGKAVSGRS